MGLDFSPVFVGWRNLLQGAFITVEITAVALLLGCIMGLLVGIGRLKPERRVVYALPGHGQTAYPLAGLPAYV